MFETNFSEQILTIEFLAFPFHECIVVGDSDGSVRVLQIPSGNCALKFKVRLVCGFCLLLEIFHSSFSLRFLHIVRYELLQQCCIAHILLWVGFRKDITRFLLQAHETRIKCLKPFSPPSGFSGDKEVVWLVTASSDGSVKVWNIDHSILQTTDVENGNFLMGYYH